MARSKSVADEFLERDRAAVSRLAVADRIRLVLELGERDLEIFRRAQHPPLSRGAAARELERRRQAGRQRSRCVDSLIE
jgi:hypothetical protein